MKLRVLLKNMLFSLIILLLLISCNNEDEMKTLEQSEAQQLKAQFGLGQANISESAMDALINFEDQTSEVTLLQFIDVTDTAKFAQYETEIGKIWNAVNADAYFSSEVFAHMISDRSFTSIRGITFPNISLLLEAIDSPEFTNAMNTLFAASNNNNTWVLGRAFNLPFEAGGSYSDPELQNLSKEDAIALLSNIIGESDLGGPDESIIDESIIIDMIVSDDPAPFWMANLIDFYEQAHYPDDPNTTLTGKEANDIYGQSITPFLMEYSSLPDLVMDIDIVLTVDSIAWEQAVLNRYASRDAFLRIFPLNPPSNEVLVHKSAGVENTIVLATEK